MRSNTRILGALTVAGVVAMTGSAFTASNTVAGDKRFGFGQTTVTGVVTTAMAFGAVSGDASKVSSVNYALSDTETQLTDDGATAVVKYGTAAQNQANTLAQKACTITAYAAGVDGGAATPGKIDCPFDPAVTISGVEVVQLVVTPEASTTGY